MMGGLTNHDLKEDDAKKLDYSDAEYTNMTYLQYNRPNDEQTRISHVISKFFLFNLKASMVSFQTCV